MAIEATGGFLPDGILEQHLRVIAETDGLDADAYADRVESESAVLAQAIRDNAGWLDSDEAKDHKARYDEIRERGLGTVNGYGSDLDAHKRLPVDARPESAPPLAPVRDSRVDAERQERNDRNEREARERAERERANERADGEGADAVRRGPGRPRKDAV